MFLIPEKYLRYQESAFPIGTNHVSLSVTVFLLSSQPAMKVAAKHFIALFMAFYCNWSRGSLTV